MYHPEVIAAREADLLRAPRLRREYPAGLPAYPAAETAERTRALVGLRRPDGSLSRHLTRDEAAFITATRLRTIIDFRAFAAFAQIDQEGHGLRPLFPLWESQAFLLERLASLERERYFARHPDGLLLNVLKARQLGVSTLAEVLLAHRLLTRPHLRALSGADVEDQAGYLFRMVARLYQHLPWFLQPRRLTFVKNRELTFQTGSSLKTAWGKSTRGALQSVSGAEGSKGALGRGQTFSCVHISELATWENPEQLDSALLPTIPIHPDTLVLFESTAEFAGDWWHEHWQTSAAHLGRFTNAFIPWGAEPSKYALPAPPDWSPSEQTLAHQIKAERELARWLGSPRTLSRDQLYWYEQTRAFYTAKGQLGTFLKEFPADDLECFQYAGQAILTIEQLEAIDRAGSQPLLDVWRVEPAREIAALRRYAEDGGGSVLAGASAPAPSAPASAPPLAPLDHRPAPPLAPRLPTVAAAVAHQLYPIPPGYGFSRLSASDLAALPSLRDSVLAIWEYPRTRGPRRYVLAVDVSDGLGQDYSVCDVIRLPTIEEPAAQVAQYVSNRVDTKQLAFICDAIGRLYPDEDGLEALAAIETNSHGLATQDTLQLHLGYSHFYVWEYADSASPERRYSTKIGWYTSARSRPLLLSAFRDAITSFDPITGQPDFVLPSAITRGELRHLVTPDVLANARAARGQHDDAAMSAAIGYYVAWRLAGGELEPIAEKRHRRSEQQQLALAQAARPRQDWRNSPATAEEADAHLEQDDEFAEDTDRASLYFDVRNAAD